MADGISDNFSNFVIKEMHTLTSLTHILSSQTKDHDLICTKTKLFTQIAVPFQTQCAMNSHTAAPLQMIMGGERVSYGNSSMRKGCDNPGGLWVEWMCVCTVVSCESRYSALHFHETEQTSQYPK